MHPENFLGYSFINKGKVGRRRRTSFSYMIKLGPQITVSYVCREHVLGSLTAELTGQGWVSRPIVSLSGACSVLLLLVLLLTKPALHFTVK